MVGTRVFGRSNRRKKKRGGPNYGGFLQQFNAFGADFGVQRPPLPLLCGVRFFFFFFLGSVQKPYHAPEGGGLAERVIKHEMRGGVRPLRDITLYI